MSTRPTFPTALHQHAAAAIVDFFRLRSGVDAVLLVNSCARGTATPESDLDIAVLVTPELSTAEREALEHAWRELYATQPVFGQLRAAGRFTGVHLDLFDGQFEPEIWDDGGGPDGFELNIGNALVYSQPLWQDNTAFAELRTRWLPYYSDDLRQARLAMARSACRYDLDHIPAYVDRGLYFQAFDRLYKAFQEFLQALFIARRMYPIAYNKWIHEQVAVRLALPELYAQLPRVIAVTDLESSELVHKADLLHELLIQWTTE